MPNNFILIKTGLTLQEIDKIGMSFTNIITLLGLGFLALVPTFVTKYMKKKGALGD
jgi:p-aminobenzoyl-glutamate transporter AbgT